MCLFCRAGEDSLFTDRKNGNFNGMYKAVFTIFIEQIQYDLLLFLPVALHNCQNAIVDPRFCLCSHQLLRYLAWLDNRSFVPGARGLLLEAKFVSVGNKKCPCCLLGFLYSGSHSASHSLTDCCFVLDADIKMSVVLCI